MFPQEVNSKKPGLIPDTFYIPEGSPEKPAFVYIKPGMFRVYMDADRGSFPVPVHEAEMARSVVEDFVTSMLQYREDAHPALLHFPIEVKEADLKKPEYVPLIKAALAKQDQWYKYLVTLADDDWSRHRRHGTISNLQRKACKALGLEREWTLISDEIGVSNALNCPACFAIVAPGAVICQVCRCVLNKEAAEKFQFAK